MRNPLRSEAEAFRFLVVVIAGAVIVVVAATINVWLGIAAAILVVGSVTWWYWSRPTPRPAPITVEGNDEPGIHHILVIANETVGGRQLRDELARLSGGQATRILVVAPALNSPVRLWTNDDDAARAAAGERVEASVASLAATGLSVQGEVGDSEPLQAIEDALRTFGADEIVISTHPEGRSHWLEQGLVVEARRRFAVPIVHVVVDLAAEGEAPA